MKNYQKNFLAGIFKRRHDRIPGVLQQSCKQFPGRVQRGWRFFCRSEQRGGPDRRKHRILDDKLMNTNNSVLEEFSAAMKDNSGVT